MATGEAVSAAAQWQDYAPSNGGDGWQDYKGQKQEPVSETDLPGSTPLLRAAAAKLPSSMSTPTEFEREREPQNRKSSRSIIGGDFNLSGIARSIGMGAEMATDTPIPGIQPRLIEDTAPWQAMKTDMEADANRKAMGRSKLYRGIAPIGEAVGVNAAGMEHEADIGNAGGVMAHTAVPAAMAVAPMAIEGGLRVAPKVGRVASVLGKPTLKMGIEAAGDIPIVRGAMRGAKAFGDVPGQLFNKVPDGLVRGTDEIFPSRPEPITPEQAHADAVRRGEIGTVYEPGDILEKPVLGRRESLADRAGIQPGRPEPNIEVTRPPEPTGLRPSAPAIARVPRPAPAWKATGASESTPIPSEVTRAPEPTGLRSRTVRPSMEKQVAPQRPSIWSYQDNLEDSGIKQSMEADLNKQGALGRREERAANTLEAKPKWLRMAEFQAQQASDKILADAEAAVSKPKKFTETPGIPSPKVATPEDLTGLLKESIRLARKKKP